jgi:hypothetical protein
MERNGAQLAWVNADERGSRIGLGRGKWRREGRADNGQNEGKRRRITAAGPREWRRSAGGRGEDGWTFAAPIDDDLLPPLEGEGGLLLL